MRHTSLLLALLPWLLASAAHAAPPNIVVILADDLGWTDLSCMDSTFYETPNIDRLAAEGMKFTRGYAACPVCSPTRVSMMTGKHPARLHTTDWFGAPQPDEAAKDARWQYAGLPAPYLEQLPLEETTIAEALKESGYTTFMAGKWHLGDEAHAPENQGFEVNRGGTAKGQPASYFSPYKNPKLKDGPEGEFLETRLATEAAQFIAVHQHAPFYLYYPLYSVHTPLQARPALVEKYERKLASLPEPRERWGKEGPHETRLNHSHATYAAMIEGMDEAVGMVLNALDEAGLRDNTLVVFTSDNGGVTTSPPHQTSNLPLRAGKGWLYEGGIRVPWLLRWPGVIAPGTTSAVPIYTADLYPTLLEAAGAPLRPQQHRDGVSLLPALHGQTLPPRPLFWHYPHFHGSHSFPGGVIIDGDWKLIRDYESRHVALYNLRDDLGEQKDLAAEDPRRTAELDARLSAWLAEMDARFPTPLANN